MPFGSIVSFHTTQSRELLCHLNSEFIYKRYLLLKAFLFFSQLKTNRKIILQMLDSWTRFIG